MSLFLQLFNFTHHKLYFAAPPQFVLIFKSRVWSQKLFIHHLSYIFASINNKTKMSIKPHPVALLYSFKMDFPFVVSKQSKKNHYFVFSCVADLNFVGCCHLYFLIFQVVGTQYFLLQHICLLYPLRNHLLLVDIEVVEGYIYIKYFYNTVVVPAFPTHGRIRITFRAPPSGREAVLCVVMQCFIHLLWQ